MDKAETSAEKPKRKTAVKSTAATGTEQKKTTRARKVAPAADIGAAPATETISAAPTEIVDEPESAEISAEMRLKMIADAAYYRAEKRADGESDQEIWLAAEAEIDAMLTQGKLSS